MESGLRSSKGIMKISSTIKKFKGIMEAWSFLFSTKKVSIKEKDEGPFSALSGTF